MINTGFEERIVHLKGNVLRMIKEREDLSSESETSEASQIWREVLDVYKYMLNLNPEDFRMIRFHSQLYTGMVYQYWHPYPALDPDAVAKQTKYEMFVKDLPLPLWIGEPVSQGLPRPLGVVYKGRVINDVVGRYQRTISNLYFSGALTNLRKKNDPKIVMEIGPGYGGLVYSLSSILDSKVTYVLVDFPEMLLHAASFLYLHKSDKSFWIYDPETFQDDFFLDEIYQYDYVFFPNYMIGRMQKIREINLAINMASFQEMNLQQLEEYLNFIGSKLNGYIYSDNLDRHPYNPNPNNLSRMLDERFLLFPPTNYYDNMHANSDPLSYACHKQYIGISKEPKSSEDWNIRKVPKFFAGLSVVSLTGQ